MSTLVFEENGYFPTPNLFSIKGVAIGYDSERLTPKFQGKLPFLTPNLFSIKGVAIVYDSERLTPKLQGKLPSQRRHEYTARSA